MDVTVPPPAPTRDLGELTDDLCEALLTARSREDMRLLLLDLCTPAEIRTLAERWHVARLLAKPNCRIARSMIAPALAPRPSFALGAF